MRLFFLCATLFIIFHALFLYFTRWQIPSRDIQKAVLVRGTISSIPEKKYHGLRFIFKANRFQNKPISAQFLLSWYHYPPKLTVGEHWQLFVKLKPPIGFHNPGGFDYARYLFSQHIVATGYVIAHGDKKLQKNDPLYFLDKIRQKMQFFIFHTISHPAIAAFISALSVGLRDGLTENDWSVFQKTGTNHLVAIAGLHIGFVALVIYFLANRIVRFYPKLLLLLPAQRCAEIISLIGALGYAALSGFAIPAERASIMLFCFTATQFFSRPSSLWRRFFITILWVLCINPLNVYSASFYLSFGSIALLIWTMSARLRSEKGLKMWIKMQITLMIGLIPLMLLYFQQVSLVSFVANTIAIPWVGFVILPITLIASLLFLCHLFFLSKYIFYFSGCFLLPLWQLLFLLSHCHFSCWHHAISNHFILFFALISVFFLLSPNKLPAKYIGCFGLLPLFLFHPKTPKVGDFSIKVMDVGQGLSALVQTAHHVMLYGAGSPAFGGMNVSESVIVPYLRYEGIHTINCFEKLHADRNHPQNTASIIRDFTVKRCNTSSSWNWDHVHFRVFYSDSHAPTIKITDANHKSALLTGNITALTEGDLIAHDNNQLKSTVLLVPHHGSRTSSSSAFLNCVKPIIGIVSVGKYGHFHLPAKSIVDRYRQDHVKLYNTAENGMITVRFLSHGKVTWSTDIGHSGNKIK